MVVVVKSVVVSMVVIVVVASVDGIVDTCTVVISANGVVT